MGATVWIKEDMRIWRRWVFRTLPKAWPSVTTIYKIMQHGIRIGVVHYGSEEEKEEGERINEIIERLSPKYKQALYEFYLMPGKPPEKARILGIHSQTLYDRRDKALIEYEKFANLRK